MRKELSLSIFSTSCSASNPINTLFPPLSLPSQKERREERKKFLRIGDNHRYKLRLCERFFLLFRIVVGKREREKREKREKKSPLLVVVAAQKEREKSLVEKREEEEL